MFTKLMINYIKKNNILIVLILLIIYNLFYIKKESFQNKKYFLVVAAIFKNEDDYLDEWITFNINVFIIFYLSDDFYPNMNTLDTPHPRQSSSG